MIKNSTAYRRLWYVKRRNSKRIVFYIYVFSIIFLFSVFTSYMDKRIMPYVEDLSEYKIKAVMTSAVNSVIKDELTEDINGFSLINLSKDEYGHITAIQADTYKMNRLSVMLSSSIQEKIQSLPDEELRIPFGAIFNNGIFSWVGPKIYVKLVPVGSVEVGYDSVFSDAGINQTRHSINLVITADVDMQAPAVHKRTEIKTIIPFSDTVIVGDVPGYYAGAKDNSGGSKVGNPAVKSDNVNRPGIKDTGKH